MGNAGAFRLHKTVVLVGMMGAGKTAVGRTLAARLDVPFLDSDAEIERVATMTIAEIFARDGEAFFRDREAEVINRLLEGPPAILSTGGGAFLAERNRLNISQKGVSLWLKADLGLLLCLVIHKYTRPLLRTANPFATLKDLFAARVPIYEMADLAVKAQPGYSLDQMTGQVVETLLTRADVLEAA